MLAFIIDTNGADTIGEHELSVVPRAGDLLRYNGNLYNILGITWTIVKYSTVHAHTVEILVKERVTA